MFGCVSFAHCMSFSLYHSAIYLCLVHMASALYVSPVVRMPRFLFLFSFQYSHFDCLYNWFVYLKMKHNSGERESMKVNTRLKEKRDFMFHIIICGSSSNNNKRNDKWSVQSDIETQAKCVLCVCVFFSHFIQIHHNKLLLKSHNTEFTISRFD